MLTGAVCCLLKTWRIDGPKDWRIAAWGGLGAGASWGEAGGPGGPGRSEAFGGANGDLGLRFLQCLGAKDALS